jgi:hypothetical protein
VEDVAKKLDIVVVKNPDRATTVMEIDLSTHEEGGSVNVIMSAKLDCRTASGKVVTVWEQPDKNVFSYPAKNREAQTLREAAVSHFFDQFINDVQQARSWMWPNQAPPKARSWMWPNQAPPIRPFKGPIWK